MSEATAMFRFENTFARDLGGLYESWTPSPSTKPSLLVLNESLADELGLDPDSFRTAAAADVFAGNAIPESSVPIAQAYSGHQFGGFSPRLGDGRALLLGELIDSVGQRRDLHLKGSGRTPFSRGGDGKAAVGPMVREYIIGEALHGLGIPTTRALAVVATGDPVMRESVLPGAVLARVASSHLRVGSFQYASASRDDTLLNRLVRYAIVRHYPSAADAANPTLALFDHVVAAQASLLAQWMNVGFIHGVMNTDNMTISGESIDFGPCAFMDRYDPATVFSSIDSGGRYAYANQPRIAQWNLARLAETLLPLIDADADRAVELATASLNGFVTAYNEAWLSGLRDKFGLTGSGDDHHELMRCGLELLRLNGVDMTMFFRALSDAMRGDPEPVRRLVLDLAAIDNWFADWSLAAGPNNETAEAMDRVNPIYIARNHLVEEALAAATAGDLGPTHTLVARLRTPFTEHSDSIRFAQPGAADAPPYRTFCGT